jgi:hypothetical protein
MQTKISNAIGQIARCRMKIVIDISEEMYQNVLNGTYCGTLYEELKNGTPLPKGHGRLIDAEVFTNNVIKYSHQSTKTIGQALADTPTIIEADKAGEEE